MPAPAMEDALAPTQDRDRPVEHLAHRGDGGHTAAGARRKCCATHLVCDPGHRAATDVRVAHHGFLAPAIGGSGAAAA